jgi:hypothetical protein
MLRSATERPGRVDGLGSADEVRSTIQRYSDAVNRHDLDAVLASRPGHVRGVDVLRVRGGKVAEKLSYVKG